MVSSVSSLGRSGVHDFILLRATAVILTLYTFYMLYFFAVTPQMDYAIWMGFWGNTYNKIFTMLALICILVHAWIGMWQVLTDYVKPVFLRGLLQLSIVTLLIVYLLTGFLVLWGV